MEKELFDWKDWDEMDTLAVYFYECVFKKPIGKFKEGDLVDGIFMEFNKGYMTINNGDEEVKYKMTLSFDEIK